MLAERQERRAKRQVLLERELERIVRVLRQVGAQRIVLFGSAARDDVSAWSDLDLIVRVLYET
jgi:predicted nucleotidyltransferase